MLKEIAICQGASYTLIIIVQHPGYISEVQRALVTLSRCPPPCIKVAGSPSLGSTGALTFSLHGWLKTVQTFLVGHSQIKCIIAEDKKTFNNLLYNTFDFSPISRHKKYSACGLVLFIALKLVKSQKCYTIYI